jgi:hypothetical protein
VRQDNHRLSYHNLNSLRIIFIRYHVCGEGTSGRSPGGHIDFQCIVLLGDLFGFVWFIAKEFILLSKNYYYVDVSMTAGGLVRLLFSMVARIIYD